MRVIKFVLEDAATGETIEKDIGPAIAAEIKRRLEEEAKNEEDKQKILEEACDLIQTIYTYIKKDAKICEIHPEGDPLTPEEQNKLDELLPEDEFTAENILGIVDILDLKDEELARQLKLLLQLRLTEE